jgi:hypothetical protein
MELESLVLTGSKSYDDWNGYRGSATFSGKLGRVQLQLSESLSEQILSVCADALVAASKQVAETLTADVIEQVASPAIEFSGERDNA